MLIWKSDILKKDFLKKGLKSTETSHEDIKHHNTRYFVIWISAWQQNVLRHQMLTPSIVELLEMWVGGGGGWGDFGITGKNVRFQKPESKQ